MTNNRRTIKHTDSHYDIEELRTDSDGNSVWAVIFCSEDNMYNGWTPSTPIKTRVMNLVEQIPTEYRNRAVAECVSENPHDFERALTGYVLGRTWETYDHPVNEAEFVDGFCDERLSQSEETDKWLDNLSQDQIDFIAWVTDNGLTDDRPYRAGDASGEFPY